MLCGLVVPYLGYFTGGLPGRQRAWTGWGEEEEGGDEFESDDFCENYDLTHNGELLL